MYSIITKGGGTIVLSVNSLIPVKRINLKYLVLLMLISSTVDLQNDKIH